MGRYATMDTSEQVLETHESADIAGVFFMPEQSHTCSAQGAPFIDHAMRVTPVSAKWVSSLDERRTLRAQEQVTVVTNGSEIQISNGFVRVHPAILELLAAADLSAGELKCVLFLIRKTYGWGKKEDALSYGQIAVAVHLSRRAVISAVQSLIAKRVITARETKIGRNGSRVYRFNKYFEQWVNVLNGEADFTIYNADNGEAHVTIEPVNSEVNVTISEQMVKQTSLEMVKQTSPTIDNIDTNTSAPSASSADDSPLLPLSEQFRLLLEKLKDPKANRPAILREVYIMCYGKSTAPDFAYLGKVAKQVGGAGRLAELLFKHVSRPPVGDILAYVLKEHKNAEKYQAMNGGNRAPTEVRFAQNGDDIYA